MYALQAVVVVLKNIRQWLVIISVPSFAVPACALVEPFVSVLLASPGLPPQRLPRIFIQDYERRPRY